jgi:hypothetical protein
MGYEETERSAVLTFAYLAVWFTQGLDTAHFARD